MSDTSNFGFGKFVPGFDFLQSLAKGASSGIPQLPSLSNWVAPTISVEELEKRIDELKAVQFWLEQNSRALTATVQALEVQKMTLATLKGMNVSMGDVAKAFKFTPDSSVMDGVQKAADTMGGAAEAMANAAARMTGRHTASDSAAHESSRDTSAAPAGNPAKENTETKGADTAEASTVDPMQWWGALTNQFQQIASTAMKDAAKHTAIDPTQNIATGLAKDAIKAATDMASQFAVKSMKTMQTRPSAAGKTRAASASATTVAKKKPAQKSAARPAAKAAPKTASPKTPARRPASR